MTTYYYYADATGANDGTSEADAWTDFENALESIAAGDILYMKKSASRVNLGGNKVVSMAAPNSTATTIVEGYETTPGDGERWQGGATQAVTINAGGNVIFKNIDYETNNSAYAWSNNNAIDHAYYYNCRFVNTNTGTGAEAFNIRFYTHCINCYFESSNNSTTGGVVLVQTNDGASFHSCVFRGNRGCYSQGTGVNVPLVFTGCVFTDGSVEAMEIGIDVDLINSTNEAAIFNVTECTFYGFGTDAIAIRELPNINTYPYNLNVIQNNIFYGSSATNAINIEDASVNTGLLIVGNAYGGVTNQVNGGGTNLQNLDAVTLSDDPFTDGANLDFSLNSTSGGGADCKDAAYPTTIQGLASTSGRHIGASQYTAEGGESISIF
ncbi:hypothetical protein CMI47_22905 [Candidatus Pacearchaeota archaeon]|nr:hypothetical protein [Candidatus Pacearchaeota archaeon]